MQCPACKNELNQVEIGDILVEVCQDGCGGLWFDNRELSKVDESRESAGEPLLQIKQKAGITVDLESRRKCPKCEDTVLMRHFFSFKRDVQVDECPSCGGYWLDIGELAGVRVESEALNQKKKREMGGSMAQMKDDSSQSVYRAKTVENVFRFLNAGRNFL